MAWLLLQLYPEDTTESCTESSCTRALASRSQTEYEAYDCAESYLHD